MSRDNYNLSVAQRAEMRELTSKLLSRARDFNVNALILVEIGMEQAGEGEATEVMQSAVIPREPSLLLKSILGMIEEENPVDFIMKAIPAVLKDMLRAHSHFAKDHSEKELSAIDIETVLQKMKQSQK
jgi:hypothetical protein